MQVLPFGGLTKHGFDIVEVKRLKHVVLEAHSAAPSSVGRLIPDADGDSKDSRSKPSQTHQIPTGGVKQVDVAYERVRVTASGSSR